MGLDEMVNDLRLIRIRKRVNQWEAFIRKYNCQIIGEIGVCKGTNFYEMIRHNPKVAVAIDSWVDDGVVARNDGMYSQEILNAQYENFKMSVADKTFVKIYREYSFDAVRHFKDNYFDLIYIDADHTYEGCLRDIEDWYPKVKDGRFLLGDYRVSNYRVRFGVIEAVNEFTKRNKLKFFELPNYGWAIIKN